MMSNATKVKVFLQPTCFHALISLFMITKAILEKCFLVTIMRVDYAKNRK